MAMVNKARVWVRSLGLSGADAMRIERALCTLADFEGPIKAAGSKLGRGNFAHAHADVCSVLRAIADAWRFGEEPRR
jgi:hypothetical protein